MLTSGILLDIVGGEAYCPKVELRRPPRFNTYRSVALGLVGSSTGAVLFGERNVVDVGLSKPMMLWKKMKNWEEEKKNIILSEEIIRIIKI